MKFVVPSPTPPEPPRLALAVDARPSFRPLLGDRVTVTLKGAPADAVAQWLALARTNARAVPVESRLTRSTAATPANAGPATLGNTGAAPVPRWDGTVVLALPAR